MAQNGWYPAINKLCLEVRSGFLSKRGVLFMKVSRRRGLFMPLYDMILKQLNISSYAFRCAF